MRGRRSFHVGAALLVVVACARTSRADPQTAIGVTVGGAADGVVGPSPASGAVHLGARADTLLLREGPRDMGLGPYLDVATQGFASIDLGGGASWLLPVLDDLPLVLGAGAFVRQGQGRSWAPGGEATLFAGSRSYNFHSWYGMAIGLFVQSRWIPAAPQTVDLVAGVQLDAELLVLPTLFILGAMKR